MRKVRLPRMDGTHFCSLSLATVLVAVLSGFGGCTESSTGIVTGTITVDGAPAESGSIAFFPVDRKSTTSGAEIVDGRYTAHVPLGIAKVEIRVPKVVGEKKLYDAPDSPTKQIMTESLPARYNDESELTLEVQPGNNQKDFSLATR